MDFSSPPAQEDNHNDRQGDDRADDDTIEFFDVEPVKIKYCDTQNSGHQNDSRA